MTEAVVCRKRFSTTSIIRTCIAFVVLWAAPHNIEAAPPVLEHLLPAGGQRGTKVIVTCTGTVTWPPKVWAPGLEVVPSSESGKLEVTIPGDLPTDRVWIRLYNAEGASALKPFLIGSLPEIAEVEPNDRPRTAQAVASLPVTINGTLKDAEVDCYAVQLTAGQILVAAVDANTRLGSPIDSIVQVVSPQGVVLAENHDDLLLDPRLTFKPPADGTYVVRLFAFPAAPDASISFKGGAGHFYRLTLTTGPFATLSVPLSMPLTNRTSTALAGWNLPTEFPATVVPLGGDKLVDQQEFEPLDELLRDPAARVGFAHSTNFEQTARIRLTPQAVVSAFSESPQASPTTITTSASVTGQLRGRKQIDEYRVALTKGKQIALSVEARSLGQPLDAVVKLLDPMGTVVAESDDTGPSRDCVIVHLAAHDGEYRIKVADRTQQGGDRAWYLLTVREDLPDFELTLASDAIVVPADKPAELVVRVKRRGHPNSATGPITIQPISLPEGVTAAAVVSAPTGPTATEVKLGLQSMGKSFSGPIRISGTSTAPREIQHFARTPAVLGAEFETVWLTAIEKP